MPACTKQVNALPLRADTVFPICLDGILGLLCGMEGVFVHALSGRVEDGAPHIVSAGFEGVRSEVLLHALEERGVYVSSGSACSAI